MWWWQPASALARPAVYPAAPAPSDQRPATRADPAAAIDLRISARSQCFLRRQHATYQLPHIHTHPGLHCSPRPWTARPKKRPAHPKRSPPPLHPLPTYDLFSPLAPSLPVIVDSLSDVSVLSDPPLPPQSI